MMTSENDLYKGGIKVYSAMLQRWGNSSGIRIPSTIKNVLHVDNGTEFEMKIIDGSIVLTPKKEVSLEEMCAKINTKNQHEEIAFGSRGKELL
ncbi:AbrB/MazE/SpoVT family DNA-binding domain-containing protein [Aureibacillus halotolerans]|uniref:Antitoxin MazE n=1 Tax=Aureibacillus halotolerans TaxID=1508390 RepID=A0A4R6TUV6_9BACI|nr:AbrB/MazE/SpoVT family DNA-binding domain-containing protein [Aureibacillus halotolerans]TDQ37181.1 antitoxin MazE [Aureibacillus halotolerans]